MLENLRYHDGEKKNDPDFAKELAALGDIYVDDAFSYRASRACFGRGDHAFYSLPMPAS